MGNVRLRHRLHARLCSWQLDQALAGGASPDAGSAALLLRAGRLISRHTQQRLFQEIRHRLVDAKRPRHRLDWNVSDQRVVVGEVQALLRAIGERLLDGGPVKATGVARTVVLLRDGTGPLYDERRICELVSSFNAALSDLDADP